MIQYESLDTAQQNLDEKLELVKDILTRVEIYPTSTSGDDIERALNELSKAQSDLKEMQDVGKVIAEKSEDHQINEAMLSSLMLTEKKYENLQGKAVDLSKRLSCMKKQKQDHENALEEYLMDLKEYEVWITNEKAKSHPLPINPTEEDLQTVKDHQVELANSLQILDEFALRCEQLQENATPAEKQTLKLRLAELQNVTSELQLDACTRQEQIQTALVVSNRLKDDLRNIEESEETLRRWVENSRNDDSVLYSSSVADQDMTIRQVSLKPHLRLNSILTINAFF